MPLAQSLRGDSFDVATTERVVYVQPSSSAVAINKIYSATPSTILGSLSANGRVVLINAAGFYFGAGSSVSAHTFIAAARNPETVTYHSDTNRISVQGDFIHDATGTGTIVAHGSFAVSQLQLVAHSVQLQSGSVATATEAVAISAVQDISIQGTVSSGTPSATDAAIDLFAGGSVVGNGSLVAEGSNATINVQTSYLSLGGSYRSDALSLHGDSVLLNSSVDITANHVTAHALTGSAIISATITAETISLQAKQSLSLLGAHLDVSSDGDAGSIAIGRSINPPTIISVHESSRLHADSRGVGDGGSIIVDGATLHFYGTATATAQQGDGGYIELSTDGALQFNHNTISVASAAGVPGTLLIDPKYLVITDSPLGLDFFQTILSQFVNSFNPITDILADTAFGSAVALSASHLVVGAASFRATPTPTSDRTGNAFIYNFATSTWIDLLSEESSFFMGANALSAGDHFGAAVAVSDTYAAIAAPGPIVTTINPTTTPKGTVFLYRLDGS